MSTTVKAVAYALLLIIGTLCDLITGRGALTPESAAVIITVAVFTGIILVIDLKFSHSRVAQVMNSPTGEELEKLIETKVEAALALMLAKIPPMNTMPIPDSVTTAATVTISPDAQS
jgi:hypothetical protein